MNPVRVSLVFAILFLLFVPTSISQQAAPAQHSVDVPFFALDSHNNPIRRLTAADFTFWEGKTQVTAPVEVHGGSELPLRLGVLVDSNASETRNDAYAAGIRAISNFVQGMMLEPNARVFFVPFASELEVTPFMSKDDLAHFQLKMKKGGGTALYDAVARACKERMADDDAHPARRVLVVVSDGNDNQSRFTQQQAINAAQNAGVVIFAVSTGKGGTGDRGEAKLRALADETGGMMLPGSSASSIARPFEAIGDQIHSLYVATYAGTQLTVKAKSEKTVKVRQGRR